MASHFASLVRSVAVAIATALLLAAGVLLGPATAFADTGDVTWTVRTAAGPLGDDRTSFTYTIDPGATIDDALVVVNRGSEPLDLGVYAADGFTTDSGQFDVLVAGEESVGIGAWVHTEADLVTVAAGETVTVPFRLTIPENATPGDYAGAVVTSLRADDGAQGVSVDRRLGIRIAVRVSGDLAPALVVDDAHVTWDGGPLPLATGDATVTYTIRNTGNVVISARQAASVAGPFGWFATEADAIDAPPQLLPGESWTQSVTLHGVGAFVLLSATATVVPLVTDAAGTTAPLAPVVASATGWAVPWPLLVLVALIAALAIGIPRVARRRRARRQAHEDARVAEAVARALDVAPVE